MHLFDRCSRFWLHFLCRFLFGDDTFLLSFGADGAIGLAQVQITFGKNNTNDGGEHETAETEKINTLRSGTLIVHWAMSKVENETEHKSDGEKMRVENPSNRIRMQSGYLAVVRVVGWKCSAVAGIVSLFSTHSPSNCCGFKFGIHKVNNSSLRRNVSSLFFRVEKRASEGVREWEECSTNVDKMPSQI